MTPPYIRSEFQDRRARLFGREGDLINLLNRRDSIGGVTFITGPGRIGKSWVTTELCRRLQQDHRWLVGRAESSGSGNLMLEALRDLYKRWLSDASYFEQAKILFHQRKETIVSDLGTAIASFLATLIGGSGPWVGVFKKAIEHLRDLNLDLKDGNLGLQLLPFDKWRDMILALKWVSDPPGIAIVLDSWEKEPDPEHDEACFHKYLDALEDWPTLHVYAVMRDFPTYKRHQRVVTRVCRDHATAALYKLGPISLSESEAEHLWQYLCREVPSMAKLGKETVLREIDGLPSAVERALFRGRAASADGFSEIDLANAVKDARACRYSELEELIPEQGRREIALMARIALLPPMTSEEHWESLRSIVYSEISDRDAELLIASLKQCRILDSESPWPSFGHQFRCEAARGLFLDAFLPYVTTEAKTLLLSLARNTHSYEEEFGLWIQSLIDLCEPINRAKLGPLFHALTIAARSLRLDQGIMRVPDDPKVWQAWSICARKYPETAPIVSMAFVNLLASDIWVGQADSYCIQKNIMVEIRSIRDMNPENPTLNMALAKSLLLLIWKASEQQLWLDCNTALAELRCLAKTNSGNKMVARILPVAVFLLFRFPMSSEEKLQHPFFREVVNLSCDPLMLDSLRNAAATEKGSIGDSFANTLAFALMLNIGGNGLFNYSEESICNAYRRPDRDALLEEMKWLSTKGEKNTSLYCWSLYHVMEGARICDDMQTYMRLYDELNTASRRLEDIAFGLRGNFAKAHFVALHHTNDHTAGLPSLIELHRRYPDDVDVCKNLANSLILVLASKDGPLTLMEIHEITKTLRTVLVSVSDETVSGGFARGLIDAWLRQLDYGDLKGAAHLANELLAAAQERLNDGLRAAIAWDIAIAVAKRAEAGKKVVCEALLTGISALCMQHRDISDVVTRGDMAYTMNFLYRWDATDPGGSEERLQRLLKFESDFSQILPQHDGGPERGIAPSDSYALVHKIGNEHPALVKKCFRMLADEMLEIAEAGKRDKVFSFELQQVMLEVISHMNEVL